MSSINQLMTTQQVCQMFGCSQSSLRTNYNRVAASIKKKYHVDLIKSFKGKQVFYQIFEDESNRALTIYNETGDIPITLESLSFEAYQFFVFLTLAASAQCVFRGTRDQLLKYIGIKGNKKNIEILNKVIDSLMKKDYIGFHEDGNTIIIYLKQRVQKDLSISINMMKECQRIANENHKNFNKIPQLMQVWEAIKICEKNQPFTYADLANLTGLSYKQIRDVKRLLEQNDAFISNRAGSYFKCLGMNVQLNGFFN